VDATPARSLMQEFQRLSSFAKLNSKKRLPCLGLIQYGPGIGPGKALRDQATGGVLHRPSEPAALIRVGCDAVWQRFNASKSALVVLPDADPPARKIFLSKMAKAGRLDPWPGQGLASFLASPSPRSVWDPSSEIYARVLHDPLFERASSAPRVCVPSAIF
jgi:hypothetical protein